jgi:hypothetical protein
MTLPVGFARRIQREFDGRLRIRWSNKQREWHVEQRVARSQVAHSPLQNDDDPAIRARDGYVFVMSVREGDRMPCPTGDGTTLKVPVGHTGEVICPTCKRYGRTGRFASSYFPLDGEALIQYLRRLDPVLGWNRGITKDIDALERSVHRGRERTVSNAIETGTLENWKRLAEIPHFGYTGKVMAGTELR